MGSEPGRYSTTLPGQNGNLSKAPSRNCPQGVCVHIPLYSNNIYISYVLYNMYNYIIVHIYIYVIIYVYINGADLDNG